MSESGLEALAPLSTEDVVRRVVEISTLPQAAMRVIEVVSDPEAGASELKAVVESDPALSARLLRVINSASSGMRTKVTNLQQAISFLGFNQVRNLALTASVGEIFKSEASIGSYTRAGLWRHMVSVGIAARLIASRCALAEFEDAFLAGLLHDLGIVIIDQVAHDHFVAVMESLDPDETLEAVERRLIGFDHAELGAELAAAWQFPELIQQTMRWHHDSARVAGPVADLVACVEIANTVCTLKGITSVGQKLVKPPLAAFKRMGFRREDILVLATDLDGEFARNRRLFEV